MSFFGLSLEEEFKAFKDRHQSECRVAEDRFREVEEVGSKETVRLRSLLSARVGQVMDMEGEMASMRITCSREESVARHERESAQASLSKSEELAFGRGIAVDDLTLEFARAFKAEGEARKDAEATRARAAEDRR